MKGLQSRDRDSACREGVGISLQNRDRERVGISLQNRDREGANFNETPWMRI